MTATSDHDEKSRVAAEAGTTASLPLTAPVAADGPKAGDTNGDMKELAVKDGDAVVDVGGKSKDNNKSDPNSETKEKGSLALFFRILSYGNRLDKVLMIVGAMTATASGVALPLMNIIFGQLVKDFTSFNVNDIESFRGQFTETTNKNTLYLVYIFIGKFILGYISMFCFRMAGIRVSAALRIGYLTALFQQPISALDKLPSGQSMELITTASNTIQSGISDKLSIMIQSTALVISGYAIAFRYSWLLTLISTSMLAFILIVYGSLAPFWMKLEKSSNHVNEQASTIAGEVFGSIRTVMALGAEGHMKKKYAGWIVESRKRGFKLAYVVATQISVAYTAVYSNFALSFWYGARMLVDGRIDSVGTIVICLFSILLVVNTLGNLIVPMIAIGKAAAASQGFWEIIDSPHTNVGGLKAPEVSAQEEITVEDVEFAYPSRAEIKVLKGVNFTVPANKITAIVGPSGCGKSTIVGLLERWYQLSDTNERIVDDKDAKSKDPVVAQEEAKKAKKAKREAKKAAKKKGGEDSSEHSTEEPKEPKELKPIFQNGGAIRIGGHNLESLDVKWWRSQIGLVQQEPFLFNDTVLNNVAMGLVGSEFEDVDDNKKRALVEEACIEAFADEFISKLPEKYDTHVGESGIKLSGGQRQRLAIARSIIKKPQILILDEATSAIDVRGEKIVQAALDRASANRTTITIAHRLATIKKADNIVVLKDGKTAEQGTHESLLQNENGVYYGLVHAQSLELGMEADDITEQDDNLVLELTKTKSARDEEVFTTDPNDSFSTEKTRGFFGSVGKLLYEQRAHKMLYFITIIAAMGGGAVFALNAYVYASVFDVFSKYTLFGGTDRLFDRVDFWALIFFILAITILVSYSTLGASAQRVATHTATTYRQQEFESILAKPISFYDKEGHSSGTLTSAVSTDPEQLKELLGVNMAFPMIAIFNVLGSVIISFSFGWKLACVAVFAALPIILTAAFMRFRYEMQFEKLNAHVFKQSSQFAAESIKAFRTVTSLTLENSILVRYDDLLQDHVHKAFLRARLAVLIFSLSDSIELLVMALAFWYGGRLIANGEYDTMSFFVIYIAAIQGGQAAGQFLSFGPNIAKAAAAANRILNLREASQFEPDLDTMPPVSSEAARIQFKDVTFKYAGRDIPVFGHLDLTVEPGQFVAFVGPSGCGKTTIISLLERFYDVTSGSIELDGQDIRNSPAQQYRQPIALVSQEPTLFEGTIRSNLLLGLPSYAPPPSDADIEAATSAASLHNFITSLPESYNTPISATTHASLSGGQKQRLCIARALIRKPRLLLLDEATSSLDSQSERDVQAALETVVAGRSMTVCVVAHRLATVQRADKIFVLGEGHGRGSKVVEAGTHKELVSRRGAYWAMCQSQALDK